jgi:3-oxoacyl-[acyl-carrier-protein] synthase I
MRRVAVTGVGIVSCLGNSYQDVVRRLRSGESGVRAVPEWGQYGIKSLIAGMLDDEETRKRATRIEKELLLGMSDAALYCSLSALDAVEDAGLSEKELRSIRTGCIVGTGTGSVVNVYKAAKLAYSGQTRRIDPFTILRCMASSASASVASLLKIHGPSYSSSAACATSAHNIGHAFSLVRSGVLDIAVAGGGEEVNELIAACFQGQRVTLSTGYNDTPKRASRPFDTARDGFVLSGGGGIVVIEELGQAQARGAKIRAEIIGYGATSDGFHMVAPRPDGILAAECMQMAIDDAGVRPEMIDYVNAHGTSTLAGDSAEIQAMRRVFGERVPSFSSTKSMTGHAIGAAGVHELIYCIGMLEQGFLAPSINVDNLDPAFEDLDLITEPVNCGPTTVLTNNFGFGGTNGSIVLRRATRKNPYK